MKSNGVLRNGPTIVPDGAGPEFTEMIVNATGLKANPRLRKVVASITRHLHDICRENDVTTEEWLAAVDFVCLFGATFCPLQYGEELSQCQVLH